MSTTQSQTQQTLQNLTSAQTTAQPNSGAVNNGNPNTAYNAPTTNAHVPPQANAAGQWWSPPAQSTNPLVQQILNSTFNRYAGQPTPPPVAAPPPAGPQVPLPPGPTDGIPVRLGGEGRGAFGGGEGSWCVSAEMLLEGSVRASRAVKGLVGTTHTPEEGFALTPIEAVGEPILQPCVLLTTAKGAQLICSVSTPFTMVGAESDDQTILAPAMNGELVYVKRGDKTKPERVVAVDDAGMQLVVPISFGGKSFPAGIQADALIYSHNMRKVEGQGVNLNAMYDNMTQQFSRSWGNSPYITTLSQMPGYNAAPAPAAPAPTAGTAAPATAAPSTPWVPGTLPYAPTVAPMPALPAGQSPSMWQSFLNNVVPRDSNGTVDWQGLLLEAAIGPGANLINTRD
jgi:hypothetical protein